MHYFKDFFSALNYGFYCFYSFTFIDVVKKISYGDFYLSNATNFAQFILTVIGVFFAYFKLKSYIRDSKIKSEILEQDLQEKKNANFYKKFKDEFIENK
jgi:predicted membrane protein